MTRFTKTIAAFATAITLAWASPPRHPPRPPGGGVGIALSALGAAGGYASYWRRLLRDA